MVAVWKLGAATTEAFPVVDRFKGPVGALALSRDRRLVASTCSSGHDKGKLRLVELATGRARWSVTLPNAHIQSLDFSPDARWLAIAALGPERTLVVSTETGRTVRTLAGGFGARFSPEGRLLLTVGHFGGDGGPCGATLYDARTGAQSRRIPIYQGTSDARFVPGGGAFVVTCSDGAARTYRTADGALQKAFPDCVGGGVGTVMSPDGRRFFSLGNENRLVLRETATGRALATVAPGLYGKSGTFIGEGSRFATTAYDSSGCRTVIWDPATGRAVLDLTGEPITFVCGSREGDLIAGSADGTVRHLRGSGPKGLATFKRRERAESSPER